MIFGGQTTTYTYDAAANVISTQLPSGNGYIETRTWDRANRLTEVKNTKGTTTLSKSTYVPDPAGNRSSVVTTTGTTTYTYDAVDRLTQACYTTACTGSDNFRRYTYDDVGNRLTEVTAAGTTTSIYDAADQLTSSTGPGGMTYTYDLDGNQKSAGTRTFTYDLAQRLKTTTSGSTTTTYTYDGDGRRISASTGTGSANTTQFLWDPNRPTAQIVEETDGAGASLREYHNGHQLVSMQTGGSAYYYQLDGLGSVVNLTSSSGTTQWTYDYHPFGVARTTTKNQNKAPVNNRRYAGEYLDATGLYHLRARQYDPSTGRLLTLDPLQAGNNLPVIASYAYARNNPVLLTDPTGQCPMTIAFVLLFGGAGTLVGPEGTFGGAAAGIALGAAVCGEEVIAEANIAKAIIDQDRGQTIPKDLNPPGVTQPYNPPPPINFDPDTGDQDPSSNNTGSPFKRGLGIGLSLALAIATLMGEEGENAPGLVGK
jgi:RHS repeat-associated protein